MRLFFSICLVCVFCFTLPGYSQARLDSLEQIIKTTTNDSLKIEALLQLANNTTNQQNAIDYGLQALQIVEKNDFSPMMHGVVLNSLGIYYYQLGNYERTLDYFYQASDVYENLGDSVAMARSYNNIGLILSDLGRLEETITYHKKSLSIKQHLGDEQGIANSYSNLGLAYEALDSLDLAMDYYQKALVLDEAMNDIYGRYTTYSNIGMNFFKRKNYDSTTYYYNKAIMLSDEINNSYNKAELLRDYATLNYAKKEYDRSIEKYNACLLLAQDVKAKSIIRDAYEGLSQVYEALGKTSRAFHYYKKYDSINEIIFNEEQNKMLSKIEGSHQIQKSQKEIELLKKESEIKDLHIRNNQYIVYFLIILLALIGALVALQYRKNKFKTKTNRLLKQQNDEIIEQNKNIMDSIVYAKNIQKAILPEGKRLKALFADAFVYSRARDVVNGDFYWFTEKDNKVIMAAVDCTGHGVPAAFLNVLGNSHLNNIVLEHQILEPSLILKHLNERILDSLTGNKTGLHSHDGMDIGLCLIDLHTKKVSFAGAKRPLYYFQNDELKIIRGESHPVGGESYSENREYEQHEISLQAGDLVYLFTDGLIDQFGGPNDKKFMYPRFRQILQDIHTKSMDEQLTLILEQYNNWKGDKEQTDDMLIIGARL